MTKNKMAIALIITVILTAFYSCIPEVKNKEIQAATPSILNNTKLNDSLLVVLNLRMSSKKADSIIASLIQRKTISNKKSFIYGQQSIEGYFGTIKLVDTALHKIEVCFNYSTTDNKVSRYWYYLVLNNDSKINAFNNYLKERFGNAALENENKKVWHNGFQSCSYYANYGYQYLLNFYDEDVVKKESNSNK